MLCVFKRLTLHDVIKIPVRYKNPPHHWSILRKKKSASQKALEHFDSLYPDIYGDLWQNIRSALLVENRNYIAVVNNYSDTKRICEDLENLGAINVKSIFDINRANSKVERVKEDIDNLNKNEDLISIDNGIDNSSYSNEENHLNEELKDLNEPFKGFPLQSIEKDIHIQNDNRIIKSSVGISASQLFEFIPPSQIKGMDDFVFESDQYINYNKGADFSIKIEEEQNFNFPDMLFLYTFDNEDNERFPMPKMGSTGVIDYFVVDSASILPVLSLDLQPGDKVLDMCAAPGGKALIALQTMIPEMIVANDLQQSRVKRIKYFYKSFVSNFEDSNNKFIITQGDARLLNDKNIYNKILVDVPCTTDRHTLHEDDNNIFKSSRLKERLKLPEIQTEILVNALKLVTCGGTVVYSTCTLNPIQNDGVVQMALKTVYEECNSTFVVKDQAPSLYPLHYLYEFANCGLRYGHIAVPTKTKNKGPLYFCKMIKVQ
ncbi:PREDICTED: 5-methylcytosine rRNA methyltransferase NSUN4 [Ceratosolen solmsi marchali]|uniref:NOL1/NOP2/Sun domain family member 4 n=1 Tax=Ceratosolen solmsi marchali TaxID=326594 RepID=A0AAJ6YWY4_9HYME|nr:PREDICTED: 5-methylcytosine rRNA methyltransferase NSUN4 [Ceratosolen solmsi marchali]